MSRKKEPTPGKSRALVEKSGCVSLWAGKFPSEDALELFIDGSDFEKEQGFVIEPPLLPFHAFLEEGSNEELLQTLVRDPKVVARAVEVLGKESANSLILHEHFEYRPDARPKKKKRMKFLGTFRPSSK